MILRVILILDPYYGDKLKNLCVNYLSMWVVNSPENTNTIHSLRLDNHYKNISLTSFSLREGESPPDACERILESLDQHHNKYSANGEYLELEVIGVTLDKISSQLFFEFGFTKFIQTDTGFIAYKTR
jgi:hypothetical protein